MESSYPHKQTIIIGAACLVAIIAVTYYTHQQKTSVNTDLNVQSSVQGKVDENTATGTTSKNWQKDFFTLSTSTQSVKSSSSSAQKGPETLTDKTGKDFFTRYMILKQANQTTDDKSVQDAMNETITNAAISAPKPKTYGVENINASADVSPASIHTYANTTASILLTYISRQDPATITSDAMTSGDMDSLAKIDPIITGYQKIISSLLAMQVPKDLVVSHVNLINSLSVLLYVCQGLRHIPTDAMQSMIALGLYSTGQDGLKSAMLGVRDFISIHNVTIQSTEPGYLFFTITP